MPASIIATVQVEVDGISLPVTTTVIATIGGLGPQGPAGNPGASFTHTQTVAAAIWTVNHNLGFNPTTEVRNNLGQVVYAEVEHLTINQSRILFASNQVGSARFN